jgi:hypothetical protein
VRIDAHVYGHFVFAPVHETVDSLVDQPSVGVATYDFGVVEVGLAVVRVVMKEWENRQINLVALQDHVLARSCIYNLRLVTKTGALCDLHADFFDIAAQSESVHFSHSIGVREKRKTAILYLLNEDGGAGVVVHEFGQFVDTFLILETSQQASFF